MHTYNYSYTLFLSLSLSLSFSFSLKHTHTHIHKNKKMKFSNYQDRTKVDTFMSKKVNINLQIFASKARTTGGVLVVLWLKR